MPMTLRHSVIDDPKGRRILDEDNDVNIMSYKCPRCAWFIRFNVIDKKRYLKKVIKKYRNGYRKFIPTCDDWSDESPEIRRQLAVYGYWAGRIDDEFPIVDKDGKITGFKKMKKWVDADGEKVIGEEIKMLKKENDG